MCACACVHVRMCALSPLSLSPLPQQAYSCKLFFIRPRPKSTNFKAQFSCTDVRHLLVADKIQNYKDFMKYHFGKHERTKELFQYFNNWFDFLDINYEKDWASFGFA